MYTMQKRMPKQAQKAAKYPDKSIKDRIHLSPPVRFPVHMATIPTVQRLAKIGPDLAREEEDEELRQRDVQIAMSSPNIRKLVLQWMTWQEKWLEKYRSQTLFYAPAIKGMKASGQSGIQLDAIKNKALDLGHKALLSNAAIARDLYVIYQERHAAAKEMDSQQPMNPPLPDLTATVTAKANAYPRHSQTQTALIRQSFRFMEENRRAMPMSLGRTLKLTPPANRTERAETANQFYEDAGKISQTARDVCSSIQGIVKDAVKSSGHDTSLNVELPTNAGRAIGKNSLGPAYAEVTVIPTGMPQAQATFKQINDPLGRIPKKLHPKIYRGISEMSRKTYASYLATTKGAASHAEVYAANKALIYEDCVGVPCNHCGVIVRTPINATGRGMHFAQCPHCNAILSGVSSQMYPKNNAYKDFKALLQRSSNLKLVWEAGAVLDPFAKALLELPHWTANEIQQVLPPGLHTRLAPGVADAICSNQELQQFYDNLRQ